MHKNSTLFSRLNFPGLAAGLLGLSGCESARDHSLTYKVWSNPEMRRFYEPAAQPHLQLYHNPITGDVLVAYDETHEAREGVHRRAYYVNRNRRKLEAGRKPRFVKVEEASGLNPVPVVASLPGPAEGNPQVSAVISTNSQSFALSGDFGGHTYQLPVYPDARGAAGRVLLTPLAVTGDVVMVGLVAGAVAALIWVSSGAPAFWQK